ncbi:DUF6302 family protein [Streptomyces sp. NPDC091292]|uniref:DUF6302 family protein n=1 Tax=Streptomyces sp. NPDC091292 TaxID=3365991 RepID=UPI00381FC9BE
MSGEAPPPLTIDVRPAHEAYDYEFVASRLHDLDLLRESIAVRIYRVPLLAVPVGGRRRGGRMDVGRSVTLALAIRTVLLGHPGFPVPRIRLTRPANVDTWLVEWGAHAPDLPSGHPERNRFFGYAEAAPTEEGCPADERSRRSR